MATTLDRIEHDKLVKEARDKGGWTGALIASWAGIAAAANRLDIDCPFGFGEHDLAKWWRRGFSEGMNAPLPRATIHHFPAKPWTPIPGCTQAAHAAGTDA